MAPFARLFSMSAFEGLRILRISQKLYPGATLGDVARMVIRVDGDAGAFDYEAALHLSEIVSQDASQDVPPDFYKRCIEDVILTQQPIWGRIMTLGRQKFIDKLSIDERQCFRESGLLVNPITLPVLSWWDRIWGLVRLAGDQIKMGRAREAERLTIDHEKDRLRALGIDREPVWVAIEDNTAGYDVLSYDIGSIEPIARLIEVKSAIVSPLRFQISRNQWEQARKFGSYHFHIWDMQARPPRLYERTQVQIAPHIPTDNERGKWQNTEIQLSACQ